MATCEMVHTVCDADFGFWTEKWGEPPVHTFRCASTATTSVRWEGEDGSGTALLCAECAAEVNA